MHRIAEDELLPLGTKIEKTLRELKKVREAKEAIMAKQREGKKNIPVVATRGP